MVARAGVVGVSLGIEGVLEETAVFGRWFPVSLEGRFNQTLMFTSSEDLFIGVPFESAFFEGFIVHMKKADTPVIHAFSWVRLKVFPKLASGMKPDFREHARIIEDACGGF